MLSESLFEIIKKIVLKFGVQNVDPEIEIPQIQYGNFTTNVSLVLAKKLHKNPFEIASSIKEELEKAEHDIKFDRIEIVPPGFINFHLSGLTISSLLKTLLKDKNNVGITQIKNKKRLMVEFAHPNTHKAFHIGHLRNITTGESIVRLLESQGHKVIRANYQGDVGLHIAKCLFGIKSQKINISEYASRTIQEKVSLLGKAYAQGSKIYEENNEAKKEIGQMNKQIYSKDSSISDVYDLTRQWSLDYFESIYKRVYSHFDRYYFESETFESGKKNVLEGLKKGVFEKSEGAIIFPGKKYGLHNRVFITGEGNATYEGKDMGLGPLQFEEYRPDKIIHVVGPEQAGYFQVVFEAMAQLFPKTKGKQQHLVYGWVKLKHGKMSSRTGNVVLGEWLIDEVKHNVNIILQKNKSKYTKKEQENIAETVAIAAVKYSFLKVGTKQEIAFDINESVSFEGDSGPYLLYTYARCKSVLNKVTGRKDMDDTVKASFVDQSNVEEKNLLHSLIQFPEIVFLSARDLTPNKICVYLYNLASFYNVFYNKHSILQSASQNQINFRLDLTEATATVIKKGLDLLGIRVLEKM